MNTIDQRILIPAPQSVVWSIISNLSSSGLWQSDWQQVAFLTTKREGRATRFRCRDARNREVVVEITAWYNGLGYEYTYVDGATVRNPVGRIRLQEIPEGTIVQWTFQWEGSRSPARQFESRIETNLKSLYRLVTQTSREHMSPSKSEMRDGVSFEERSQYQPRHGALGQEFEFSFDDLPAGGALAADSGSTSNEFSFDFADEPPISIGDAQMVAVQPFDFEPPVREDDTRPRPTVATSPPVIVLPDDFAGDPDFLDELEIEADAEAFADHAVQAEPILPASPIAVDDRPQDKATDSTSYIVDADSSVSWPAQKIYDPVTPGVPPAAESVRSIWEIFGVPRPSETSEHAAVAVDSGADTPSEDLPVAAPEADRVDLPAAAEATAVPSEAALVDLTAEPVLAPDDTEPLTEGEADELYAISDSTPKPPPGLMEALEALKTSTPPPPQLSPSRSVLLRKGGHRMRVRRRLVRLRRPV